MLQKDVLLTELKKKSDIIPTGYISPAWAIVNYTVSTLTDALQVVSKPWIIGFTEAEGSFYLFKKSTNRITHAFELVQKLDKIVLVAVGLILGVTVREKKTYFTLYVDSIRMIPSIIKFFDKTMKGMKSIEYRIWARSFMKTTRGSKGYDYLLEIQHKLRKIRSIRLNGLFKVDHYKSLRKFK
jgi:hypothetical protein